MADDPNPPAPVDPTTSTPPAAPAPDLAVTAAQLAAAKAENDRLARERDEASRKAQELEAREAERERKRLEEEGKFKELADRSAQDAARARAEAEEATSRANKIQIDSELRVALIREGAYDPDVAILIDKSAIKVEGGRVVGVDDAVKNFKESKGHFFGKAPSTAPSTSAGGTTPIPSHDPPPPKDLSKMSKEEYRAYKQGHLRALRTGRRA